MPIPDYQTVMLPLLRFAADQQEHSNREAIEALSQHFSLTEDERRELLPSGRQPTFDNRVTWAITYLRKAGLLEPTRRAHFRITSRGRAVLNERLERVDVKFLEQFPEFISFRGTRIREGRRSVVPAEQNIVLPEPDTATPEEEIEAAHQKVRNALATELLQQVMSCSPAFFERLVVDLLLHMGYGGTRQDAGQAIGKSGDGGIDGIIKEDRLGLDVIYIQAKRWEGSVGRPEVQKFVGALQGQRSRKGILITTSSFTSDAVRYAEMIENKIVLIDGETLARLMINHSVGVSPVVTHEIKRIDSDYFVEA